MWCVGLNEWAQNQAQHGPTPTGYPASLSFLSPPNLLLFILLRNLSLMIQDKIFSMMYTSTASNRQTSPVLLTQVTQCKNQSYYYEIGVNISILLHIKPIQRKLGREGYLVYVTKANAHTHTHIKASNKTLVPLLRLVPIEFHSPPGVKEKKREQETVFVMT